MGYRDRKNDMKAIRQKGLTAVELVVVLAIIATLITIAAASRKAIETGKIQKTVNEIETLRKIVENYVRTNALVNYQNATLANMAQTDQDALKFWNWQWGVPKNVNPWGGSYNVTSEPPYSTYTIIVTKIPLSVVNTFISIYRGGAASAAHYIDYGTDATLYVIFN